MRRPIIALIALIPLPAYATPYINVHSFWSAYLWTPGTVSSSCTGTASALVGGGCTDSITVSRSIADTETDSVLRNSTATFTNIGTALDIIEIDASPFNPGGPWTGVAIDTAANQTASFLSNVQIFYDTSELALTNGCSLPSTPGPQPDGYVFSPTSCGLQSPDASSAFVYLNPGDDVTLYATLSLSYAFDPPSDVPEPASFLLLGIGAVGIGLVRRR